MADKVSVKKLIQIVQPIVESLEFEMVDVEFVKEAGTWYLRVYIDVENGVSTDDCETVSRELSKELDEKDPIEQSYILEVSSPGIDRPLKKEKDFERFKGHNVEVKLYKSLNGQKLFNGELVGLKDNKIIIKSNEEIIEFEKDDVAIVRLAVEF